MLHLTPARHGTDGFFVAVLERRAAAAGTWRWTPPGTTTKTCPGADEPLPIAS